MAEYLTERSNWIADNTGSLSPDLQAKFKPREIKSYWDTTAQIGGPLVKDKLFFFTGFQYFNRQDRPAGFTGDYTSEKDPRYLGKMTWSASPNVRVEGFVEWDKYDIAGRGASARRPTTAVTALEPSPEWNWNAQVTWTIDSKTMLNVRNGGYTGYFPVEPTPPQTRSGPYPHYDPIPDVYTINVPYYGQFDRTRNVTAATLTRYADHFRRQGARIQVRCGIRALEDPQRIRAIRAAGITTTTAASPTPLRCGRATSSALRPTAPPLRAGHVDGHGSSDAQPGHPPRYQSWLSAQRQRPKQSRARRANRRGF